jgi:hypothetical protein
VVLPPAEQRFYGRMQTALRRAARAGREKPETPESAATVDGDA